LLVAAIIIGVGSLWYTNRLVAQLKAGERKMVELWASATKELIELDDPNVDIDFIFKVIENNTSVPVILVDESGDTISTRNLDYTRLSNPRYLERQMAKMKTQHEPIAIRLDTASSNTIYYKDSLVLEKLQYFPYIQLGVIILFILVAYLAFNSSRKFEQNQVWVGLTKETAHQLGTPTSSLIGWLDVLKMKKNNLEFIHEFENDVNRLEKITDRFSKIGSKPKLSQTRLIPVIRNAVQYIMSRSSQQVRISVHAADHEEIMVPLNIPLFEWVVENLSKNAIDAMDGNGTLDIRVTGHPRTVSIDFEDTGKGIPKSKFKTIFKPGFTTKERGWGLGLSLSKRIIEMYHGGKIFVYHSELNQGATIRIILKK
jgi:nitrogen-specific signal transduction histidine kinase